MHLSKISLSWKGTKILTRMSSISELYKRVPWGRKKQLPGLNSLKKNNSCSYKRSRLIFSLVILQSILLIIPSQFYDDHASRPQQGRLCTQPIVFYRGRRYRRFVAGNRWPGFQGSMMQSSFEEGISIHFLNPKKCKYTFVTMNDLIRPVWGIWGPTQRSIIGPQRYTVVDVPSGILDSMICFLYLLY